MSACWGCFNSPQALFMLCQAALNQPHFKNCLSTFEAGWRVLKSVLESIENCNNGAKLLAKTQYLRRRFGNIAIVAVQTFSALDRERNDTKNETHGGEFHCRGL